MNKFRPRKIYIPVDSNKSISEQIKYYWFNNAFWSVVKWLQEYIHIDTVYFDNNISDIDVLKSLVNHDNYPESIITFDLI